MEAKWMMSMTKVISMVMAMLLVVVMLKYRTKLVFSMFMVSMFVVSMLEGVVGGVHVDKIGGHHVD
jgi:hypothetical protein